MLKFENKKNGRYFYVERSVDIFNDNIIRIIRGGIYSGIRAVRTLYFDNDEMLEKEIERLTKKRLKRGYILMNTEARQS